MKSNMTILYTLFKCLRSLTIVIGLLLLNISLHAQPPGGDPPTNPGPCTMVHTVTGSGVTCGTGTITLSSSSGGISYELKLGTTPVSAPQIGNNSALTWTVTTSGTYSITATNSETNCSTEMNGSPTVTINPSPTEFSISSNSPVCSGTAAHITLSGSQTSVNYQLKVNGSNYRAAIAGTGAALTWADVTFGTYTIVASNTTNSCTTTMSGSQVVVINPNPNSLINFVSGSTSSICEGTSQTLSISTSEVGVSYQLRLDGVNIHSPVNGTGGSISFTPITAAGVYRVQATNISTGCSIQLSAIRTVTGNTAPTDKVWSGPTTFCELTMATFSLTNSQTGIRYDLLRDGANANWVNGNGSTITWEAEVAGTYTIKATNTTTACTRMMLGSVVLIKNSAPYLLGSNWNGGGVICEGSAQTMSMGQSQTGVSYQLKLNGVDIASPVSGTGGTITFPPVSAVGTYTLHATMTSTGCTSVHSQTKTITTNPLPTDLPMIGAGTICGSGTLSINSSQVGVRYELVRDNAWSAGVLGGTGGTLNWNVNTIGSYRIRAQDLNTNCWRDFSASAQVIAGPSPSYPTLVGGGMICSNSSQTMTVTNSQAGVTYQLRHNGNLIGSAINGTGGTIAFAPVNTAGDYSVLATLVSNGCTTILTTTRTLTVNPSPVVYTISGAGAICNDGSTQTVTLSGSQEGNVSYQLRVNNVDHQSPKTGNGLPLTWTGLQTSGTITMIATLNGCSNTMNGSLTASVLSRPSAFSLSSNVTSYCEGNTGATLTLAGSATGVNYQLKNDGVNVGAVVAGTGSSLSWTNQPAGTYTVVATHVNGCTNTSTGPTVVMNPSPTVYTITGGGTICNDGTSTQTVTLNGSQTNVSYQLVLNGADFGTAKIGNGSPLIWSSLTASGTFTMRATINVCTKMMNGSLPVSSNPRPGEKSLSISFSTYCSGTPGPTLTLTSSQSGVNYQLRKDGANTGSPLAGNGSNLTWSNLAGGVYTVMATNATTGCFYLIDAYNIAVTERQAPVIFNVSGGGSMCSGNSGTVNLSGSETGTSYQLLHNGANAFLPLAGTGAPLNWQNISTSGTYTVVATRNSCNTTMNGSAPVTINQVPGEKSLSISFSSYCSGTPGPTLTLAFSQSGVNYQLRRYGTNTGGPLAGNGSALTWSNLAGGVYTVMATNATTGCFFLIDAYNVTVTENQTPTTFNITGGGTICNDGANAQTVTMDGSESGVSYQLLLNNNPFQTPKTGTGSALAWTGLAANGTLTVRASINGCTKVMNGSLAASALVTPSPVTLNTNLTSYCEGSASATLNLGGSNTNESYQLKRDGVNVGAAVTGTGSALYWNNQPSGVYSILVTNITTSCSRTSSGPTITMNITPVAYTISGTSICNNSTTTISLSGSQVGINYQLLKSGVNVGSAVAGTGNSLSWPDQTSGTFSVVATSAACGSVTTSSLTLSNNPLPNNYGLGGSTVFCEGSTLSITLSGSQSGVNYQLQKDGVATGALVPGTGASLSFPTQSGGTYNVLATNVTTGCNRLMTTPRVITMNPAPTSFTMSGGGGICSGGSPSITLAGSEVGVNYQLRRNGSVHQAVQSGSGSSIIWTGLTQAATYTILATRTATACSKVLESTVVITVNPLPTTLSLGGSTSYCEGTSGVTITLSTAQAGVNYQLQRDGINVDVVKAGGVALSWTSQTAGVYTIIATFQTTGCTKVLGPRTITMTSTPLLQTVSGTATICSGASTQVLLSGSETGVNYQLKLGSANSGSAVAGTGSPLIWTVTSAGTYTVVATRGSCASRAMTANAVITFHTQPTAYTVNGVATFCEGTGGLPITLSGSQTNVTYQLRRNGVNEGTPKAGTGSGLSWPNQLEGTYNVIATSNTTGCPRTMTATVVRTVNPAPTKFELSSSEYVCTGATGSIMLSSSESGVNYQLRLAGAPVGTVVAGTGSGITWPNITAAGTYSVSATRVSTTCAGSMNNETQLQFINPPAAVVSGSTSLGNGPVTLSAQPTGQGYVYTWIHDGQVIENETSSSIQASYPGQYQVRVGLGDCDNISQAHTLANPVKPYYNGMITSVRWRTEEASFVSAGEEQGEYTGALVFNYDDKYQIQEARFGQASLTGITFEGNRFRLSNMTYDPNGNILTLKRFDGQGLQKNNFNYSYNSAPGQIQNNMLESVNAHANYKYNQIGQLTEEDKVSGEDQVVEYDVSGKVRKVFATKNGDGTFDDLKVEFLYDDKGMRMAKINHATQRTTWYVRDAGGKIVSTYEQKGVIDSENEEAQNTETLVPTEIPLYGAGKLGTLYPSEHNSTNYELTDHLGNVRALVRDNKTVFIATMEDSGEDSYSNPRVAEIGYFENVTETEDENIYMNHTPPGPVVQNPNKASYLRWVNGMEDIGPDKKAMGPAIALKVNKGDVVEIETWARFERKANFARDLPLLAIASFLGERFVGGNGFESLSIENATLNINDGLAGFGYPDDDTEDQVPFAYLNYMIFDDDQNMINAGWKRVGDDAGFYTNEMGLLNDHEHLSFDGPINIDQKGYIYVWVSNQSEDSRVWFDDLTVKFSGHFVSQATDYGVWGDVIREQKTDESFYRFGYQGQFAEKDEETGWNHFELREYDPVIGRWTAVDPNRQHPSPYVGNGNDPVNRLDMDGGFDDYLDNGDGTFTLLRKTDDAFDVVYAKGACYDLDMDMVAGNVVGIVNKGFLSMDLDLYNNSNFINVNNMDDQKSYLDFILSYSMAADKEIMGFFVNSGDKVDDLYLTPVGANTFKSATAGMHKFMKSGKYDRIFHEFKLDGKSYTFNKWFHTHPGANMGRAGYGYADPSPGDIQTTKYLDIIGIIYGSRGGIGAICPK
jgi:RHS repeat-associated protein